MDTSDITTRFDQIADAYDPNRRRFIPCFDAFYVDATAFLASLVPGPARIVDLGAGTGLLSAVWLEHFPEAQFVLVDVSEKMLDVARSRFASRPNVRVEVMDYSRQLPPGPFDIVLSALSIHHLADWEKMQLFERIHALLPPGGLFANYDQFCADDPRMADWQDAYWEAQLHENGLGQNDLDAWRQRRRLDRECSVSFELDMLRNAGFSPVSCVFSELKFAVLAALR